MRCRAMVFLWIYIAFMPDNSVLWKRGSPRWSAYRVSMPGIHCVRNEHSLEGVKLSVSRGETVCYLVQVLAVLKFRGKCFYILRGSLTFIHYSLWFCNVLKSPVETLNHGNVSLHDSKVPVDGQREAKIYFLEGRRIWKSRHYALENFDTVFVREGSWKTTIEKR